MNVFTYGTLMFPEVMECLTSRQFTCEDAVLANYERRKLLGKSYPGLVQAAGAQVAGKLYFDVDEDSLTILDCFEDEIYDRRHIPIQSLSKGEVIALTYIIPDHLLSTVSSEAWDLEEFKRKHLSNYLEMCRRVRADILQQIEGV
jgi:gamma-glutamylcyclotransferase (GGCT)/AIG2-like uncharacterized protein YtfP